VFPDADDGPATDSQTGVGVPVARDVAPQFLAPPLGVGPRAGTVLGASVPEAAVDEDGDTRPTEDDVRSTAKLGDGAKIDSVSKAPSVQRTAKSQLRSSIAAGLPLHSP
jgi:hypothetical protein